MDMPEKKMDIFTFRILTTCWNCDTEYNMIVREVKQYHHASGRCPECNANQQIVFRILQMGKETPPIKGWKARG